MPPVASAACWTGKLHSLEISAAVKVELVQCLARGERARGVVARAPLTTHGKASPGYAIQVERLS